MNTSPATLRYYLADALRSRSSTSIGPAESFVTPEDLERPSNVLRNSRGIGHKKSLGFWTLALFVGLEFYSARQQRWLGGGHYW